MTKEKVTLADLRELIPNKPEIFVLPTAKQCLSVRSMCSRLKSYEGIAFRTSIDIPNKTISVTRL